MEMSSLLQTLKLLQSFLARAKSSHSGIIYRAFFI